MATFHVRIKSSQFFLEGHAGWPQGDFHGCPYRVWDKEAVRAALVRMKVTSGKVEEAMNRAKGGHFQLACASAWEGVHRCHCDTGINHPNQV